MRKYILEIIVFLVGAAILILELTGSRVLAPYLGTSIFVWTSLIGIVLASLSLGYWYGGRLADKNPSYKILSTIIFLGAVATAYIALVKELLLAILSANIPDLRLGSVLASLFLLAPASTILGMVSPYAVKLKMKDLKRTGRTVGNLYAISTIGSIFGTFVAGFWLIAYFGNTKILLVIAIVLIVASMLAYTAGIAKLKLILKLFLIASLFGVDTFQSLVLGSNLVDIDTQYNRVWIFDTVDPESGRPIKALLFDPKAVQSAIFLDGDELVFDYSKFYRLARHFKEEIKNSLAVGGAAYTYPRDYLRAYPQALLDIVEIDPKLTELAKKHFRLVENPRMKIYHEDGRTFINNKTAAIYDAIFVDAFSSSFSVPYQLTTEEAVEGLYRLLNDDGVVLANIISSVEGKRGKFLRAEYWTYRKVFPQVFLFPVEDPDDGSRVQNIIIVAVKSDEAVSFESDSDELNFYLGHLWTKDVPGDVPILSDDYAPVDQYMMELI